jgi:hypothetical protein
VAITIQPAISSAASTAIQAPLAPRRFATLAIVAPRRFATLAISRATVAGSWPIRGAGAGMIMVFVNFFSATGGEG